MPVGSGFFGGLSVSHVSVFGRFGGRIPRLGDYKIEPDY